MEEEEKGCRGLASNRKMIFGLENVRKGSLIKNMMTFANSSVCCSIIIRFLVCSRSPPTYAPAAARASTGPSGDSSFSRSADFNRKNQFRQSKRSLLCSIVDDSPPEISQDTQ